MKKYVASLHYLLVAVLLVGLLQPAMASAASELNVPTRLEITPGAERVLAGSNLHFEAAGLDVNGDPVPITGGLRWEADPSIGTINDQGVLTAAMASGVGTVTASTYSLGELGEQIPGITGTATVEIVAELTEIRFPEVAKTYSPGDVSLLSVIALRNGQTVQANNESFTWRVEGNVGTIDENGVFAATDSYGGEGKIYASYGSVEASFEVNVGLPPVVLEDFESGLASYMASNAKANSVSIQIENDQDYVRNGNAALRLDYDFVGQTGTSGAYLAAKTTADRIQVPGYPEKIGMWVYGDGKGHWLRAQMRDGNNGAIPLDFTDNLTGVDWTGWKYVEAVVPKGKQTPFTMDMPVRYMSTKNDKKSAGVLYIDDIRAVYGPLNEDVEAPVFKEQYPANNEVIKNATPTISIIGEDAGYDKETNPGTTLIDPLKTRVYIDGELVQHGFDPAEGRITYKPAAPLAEGRHKVKVAIRDLAGNQSIAEWFFMVNLGSPYYVYETPLEQFAGETYTLDLRAENINKLKEGQIQFQFNPSAVRDLTVIAGSKIGENHLVAITEESKGTVSISMSDMQASGLSASDVIAQIRYTVKNSFIGNYTLEQLPSGVSKPHVIENSSGSATSIDKPDAPVSFVGAALEPVVKANLRLTWRHDSIALGYPISFKIENMTNGTAIEGARLLLDEVVIEETFSDKNGVLTTSGATKGEGSFKLQAVIGNQYSPVMTFKVAKHAGSPAPQNINVTMGVDPATSRQLAWQSDPLTEGTVVEFAKQDGFAGFDKEGVVRVEGFSYLYNTNNDGTLRVHKAELTRLEPDTAYVYRVGDGGSNVSGQGVFRTSSRAKDEPLKFLFIGDSQADSQKGFELWGQTLDAAMTAEPDAEMVVHAGDMVDKGFEQEQWNWWFEAAQGRLLQTTLVAAIGNHEVMGTNGNGDYLAQFHNPQNGANSVKGTNFSFDIKDTHFVVMNTESSKQVLDEQAKWLAKDLAATDKKWKVIFFHQGPYGSIYANENVQSLWVPVFDQYGVDLVLNGHDHIYMRSYPMRGGKKAEEGKGTRYVIGGSSGPKFYSLTKRPWQEVIYEENKQLYTTVEINKDEITVVGKTLDGTEVDRFSMGKVEAAPQPSNPFLPWNPPGTPQPEPSLGALEVSEEDLSSPPIDGAVTITFEDSLSTMEIPADAIQKLNGSALRVSAANMTMLIPDSVLQQLVNLLPESERRSGTITLTAQTAQGDAVAAIAQKASQITGANVRAVGDIIDFSLTVTDKEGRPSDLSEFTEPLVLSLPVKEAGNASIRGIYYVEANGTLQYAGGEVADGKIWAPISHFSTYAVLEYDKSFSDLLSTHWAYNTVKELAAKQLVNGKSEQHFAPDQSVSRAEFATMLVRLLGLTGDVSSPFKDVRDDAWYGNDVALAWEAGIITGKNATTFSPEAEVTRQEMAAMLVRAYRYGGGTPAQAEPSRFSDVAAAPGWAREAIGIAADQGLMVGRGNERFAPESLGTRAESARMMLNLINLMKSGK